MENLCIHCYAKHLEQKQTELQTKYEETENTLQDTIANYASLAVKIHQTLLGDCQEGISQ